MTKLASPCLIAGEETAKQFVTKHKCLLRITQSPGSSERTLCRLRISMWVDNARRSSWRRPLKIELTRNYLLISIYPRQIRKRAQRRKIIMQQTSNTVDKFDNKRKASSADALHAKMLHTQNVQTGQSNETWEHNVYMATTSLLLFSFFVFCF